MSSRSSSAWATRQWQSSGSRPGETEAPLLRTCSEYKSQSSHSTTRNQRMDGWGSPCTVYISRQTGRRCWCIGSRTGTRKGRVSLTTTNHPAASRHMHTYVVVGAIAHLHGCCFAWGARRLFLRMLGRDGTLALPERREAEQEAPGSNGGGSLGARRGCQFVRLFQRLEDNGMRGGKIKT